MTLKFVRIPIVTTFVYMFLYFAFESASFAGPDNEDKMNIEYGIVESIEVTTKESALKRNAIIGGILGVVIDGSKWHVASSAASGAVAAVVATSIIEGDRRVYLYQIKTNTAEELKITLEHGGLSPGQCVAIESGKGVNLRHVSSVHCESPKEEGLQHPTVEMVRHDHAIRCEQAKQELAQAESAGQIDALLVKIRALCES